jgi:hypothetical protein
MDGADERDFAVSLDLAELPRLSLLADRAEAHSVAFGCGVDLARTESL